MQSRELGQLRGEINHQFIIHNEYNSFFDFFFVVKSFIILMSGVRIHFKKILTLKIN